MNDWVAKLPEAISVPLLITAESNGKGLYANSSFGTLAGVAAEDLIGKNVSDLQTDHPGGSSLVQMMGGHQSSRNMEIELSRGDGSPVWLAVTESPISYRGQSAQLCAFHDITERKRYAQQLEESSVAMAEMATFPEMNPGPVCRINPEGVVLLANAAARDILVRHDLVGRSWFEVCPELTPEMWEDCTARGKPVRHESAIDGRWLEFVYRCQAEKKLVFVFGSDITDRKHSEEELEKSAAAVKEMATFPDMNPGPVFRTDHEGTIVLANRAARRLFPKEELAGKSWPDLCPGMSPGTWIDVLAAPEPYEHEANISQKVFLFAHTHREDSEYVFVYGTDLSSQKQAEKALAQSQKMATLGTLAAGVAHELNNPAAATQRGAEQLRDAFTRLQRAYAELNRQQLSPEQRDRLDGFDEEVRERAANPQVLDPLARSDLEVELEDWLEANGVENAWELAAPLVDTGIGTARLDKLQVDFSAQGFASVIGWVGQTYPVYALLYEIGQSATRISQIVKALKEYSFLGEAPVQEVDVREGIDNTLVILRNKLKLGINVHREYDEDLPRIQAYGSELNQVWTNILDNASGAMGDSGQIIIRVYRNQTSVVVEIEDDGPGIRQEIQSRIFDPFFTTKAPGEGTGLGMSISHGIVVEKHNGAISLESKPGKTLFRVELPIDFQAAERSTEQPAIATAESTD